jgi:hypothetical protein
VRRALEFAVWRLARVLAAGAIGATLLLTFMCAAPHHCNYECRKAEDRR